MNVFISYRRRHGGKAYAHLLCQKLKALGIGVFFDLISLHDKNNDYQSEIQKNIENSDYFILLLQPQMFRNLDGTDLIDEIRLAHKLKKEIIVIPLEANFNWERELPLPSELDEVRLPYLQLMSCITFEKIDSFMSDLIGRFTHHQSQAPYYQLLLSVSQYSSSGFFIPESVITNVPLETRWNGAKRISLLSIGGGSILGLYHKTVSDMFAQGVEFRFVTIDYKGKSRKDVEGKKVYSAFSGQDNGYLKQRQGQISTVIKAMQNKNPPELKNNIGYRVTSEHITMTIQLIESDPKENSYIFISLLPTVSTNQQQSDSGSALIPYSSPLYSFFANQFELIWEESRIII